MQSSKHQLVLHCSERALTGSSVWDSGAYTLILVTGGTAEITCALPPGAVSPEEEGDGTFSAAGFFAARPAGALRIIGRPSCSFVILSLNPSVCLSLPGGRELMSSPVNEASLSQAEIQRLRELFSGCAGYAGSDSSSPLAADSEALMILHVLTRHARRPDPVPAPLTPLSDHRLALYRSVRLYMDEHADSSLTQAEAAAAHGITPQYLGRLLKEAAGKPFAEYFREIREDYLHAWEQAEKAAAETVRTKLPGAPVPEALREPAGPSGAGNAGPERSGQIRSSLTLSRRLQRHWMKLVNLGYAVSLRDLEIDRVLQRMQKECAFEYGRVCRITDLIASYSADGREFHDYSPVFSLLDHLMEAGIIPFLELGNKAFAIQETAEVGFLPVSPVDTRRYFSDLLAILPGFLRACINHYGQENFDRWHFEISYMYTDSEAKETFGLIQYIRVFRKIYSVIRQFSDTCRIGGPGFNDWSSPEKAVQAVRLMSSHGAVPDFFTAYIYPLDIEDGVVSLSPDPDTAVSRIRLFSKTVETYCPGSEIWITEFNSSLSSRNFLNDSCYQAAFLAKMILETAEENISALGYYILSDAPLRYLDSLDFMFGGWGLFTDAGIPKPSWHTFRMMNMLGHYLVRIRDNCLITANSAGSIRFLLFRYCHPAARFLRANVERDDLMAPEGVFTGLGTDRFRLCLNGILKGTYIMREYRLNSTSGSLYASWKNLGFLYPTDAETAAELSAASEPLPRASVYIQRENRPFETDIVLRDNEVFLLSLELYTSRI